MKIIIKMSIKDDDDNIQIPIKNSKKEFINLEIIKPYFHLHNRLIMTRL